MSTDNPSEGAPITSVPWRSIFKYSNCQRSDTLFRISSKYWNKILFSQKKRTFDWKYVYSSYVCRSIFLSKTLFIEQPRFIRGMNDPSPNLVTTYIFKGGKEYLIKMRVTASRGGSQRTLDLTVTDKYTSEDWRSSYDTGYIENLTHKTGNYKQFDVFIAMLQSGLLKTSESVSLDLLTFEDLEHLRSRRRDGSPASSSAAAVNKNANRRYLILTYSVEFDRIHYPLPLEYCGPPDAAILQATIRRLEGDIERLQSTRGGGKELYKKIEQLTLMNKRLVEENSRLSNSGKGIRRLLVAVKCLESTVSQERTSFRAQISKLRAENAALTMRLRQFTENAGGIRASNSSPTIKRRMPLMPTLSRRSTARRSRSRSNSVRSRMKGISISPGSTSVDSLKSADSPQRESIRSHKFGGKVIDFGNLESRIHALQKMLQDGINLN